MGIVFSNILNYDSQEIEEVNAIRNKCNNIIATLEKINQRLSNTDQLLKEIEEDIKKENSFKYNITMEWDYYDLDMMETKKIK